MNIYISTFNRPDLAIGAARSVRAHALDPVRVIAVCAGDRVVSDVFDDVVQAPFGPNGGFGAAMRIDPGPAIAIDDDVRLVGKVRLADLPAVRPAGGHWVRHWGGPLAAEASIRIGRESLCGAMPEELCRVAVGAQAELLWPWLHIDKGHRQPTPSREALIAYVDSVLPVIPQGGPGTVLKAMLATLGIHADGQCKCNKMARQMDAWGPDESLKHIEEIVSVMEETAKKRKLPFLRTVGRALVRRAISKSRAMVSRETQHGMG